MNFNRTNPFLGNVATLDDYLSYLDSIMDTILSLSDGECFKIW